VSAIYNLAEVVSPVEDGDFLTMAVNDTEFPLQQLIDGTANWQHTVTDLSLFAAAGTTSNVHVRLSFCTSDAIVSKFLAFYVADVLIRASGGLTVPKEPEAGQVLLGL
jgi:hypothetical protein